MAKTKANEIEAQAIAGNGKKIIIMSKPKKKKKTPNVTRYFSSHLKREVGCLITSITHPLRHAILTSNNRYFLRLSP